MDNLYTEEGSGGVARIRPASQRKQQGRNSRVTAVYDDFNDPFQDIPSHKHKPDPASTNVDRDPYKNTQGDRGVQKYANEYTSDPDARNGREYYPRRQPPPPRGDRVSSDYDRFPGGYVERVRVRQKPAPDRRPDEGHRYEERRPAEPRGGGAYRDGDDYYEARRTPPPRYESGYPRECDRYDIEIRDPTGRVYDKPGPYDHHYRGHDEYYEPEYVPRNAYASSGLGHRDQATPTPVPTQVDDYYPDAYKHGSRSSSQADDKQPLSVEARVLNTKVSAGGGIHFGIGDENKELVGAEAQKGPAFAKAALSAKTAAKVGKEGAAVHVLGTGISLGRETSVSLFGSKIGLKFW